MTDPVITPADEWHVHQTAEPIAFAGTDRNFYDRSFFSGFTPDGSVFVAVAFGVYPHLNVADAHIGIVVDGTQHNLHASRILHMDRSVLAVGPFSIEIVEPLQRLRVRVADTDGIGADLDLVGRSFPFHEPRFTHRIGPRTFQDYTRISQGMLVTGRVTVDGTTHELGAGTVGLRDRSWGIRSVGAPDPQPHAPAVEPQFFWAWAPIHLPDATAFFHVCADRTGNRWNTRACYCPDGSGADGQVAGRADLTVELRDGTRWAERASLAAHYDDGLELTYAFEPVTRFQMQGIGYFHPRWAHGALHGELDVEREDMDLGAVDPGLYPNFHIQALSRVTVHRGDDAVAEGTGILEQLVIGPYDPYGLS